MGKINKMDMSFIEQIKNEVNSLCEQHNLKQPMVVPGAAKIIMEYKGIDRAIELFEGAYNECRNNPDATNPFAFAAYKATLETTLKRD
jgi:hypothetical protein